MSHLKFLILLSFLCAIEAACHAQEPKKEWFDANTPIYCGLYSIQAAASALGEHVEVETIVDEKYLTGKYGSSADDLLRALDASNLMGSFDAFITLDELSAAKSPVILSVRPLGTLQYVHWAVFLGVEDGKFRIYYPPHDTGLISAAELQAMYSGNGVWVTKKNERLAQTSVIDANFHSIIRLLCGAAVLLVLSTFRFEGFALIALSTLLLIFAFQISTDSLLRSPQALSKIDQSFITNDFHNINVDEASRRHKAGGTIFIDARVTDDYARGHIPDAISIPITDSVIALDRKLNDIPSNKPIVVYCANENCRWADKIAGYIKGNGFKDITVFRDGMAGWKDASKDVK